ncbi:SHOCT domain-containing protein [Marinactinospora thermotolerans]|uniref:Putative membrane protein n=1 Tax=Marinactinospora thermotolerans DSM 45154 TaxID=1122192 RepID=A0A1T4RUJ8_9ACTN|nr:hypothetical protein [Marinactinospora thermotolerans]SKA19645.1 putative membrane protein [Marinactinospora thermotolerans DSM 45154]
MYSMFLATGAAASGAIAQAAPSWGDGPPLFLHAFGGTMFLLFLLIGLVVFLSVRRHGGRPPWARPAAEPPETSAKRMLAERFARGELSVEEFMERASALNWTPGSPPKGRR